MEAGVFEGVETAEALSVCVFVCVSVCVCVGGLVPKSSQMTLHPHYSPQPGTSKQAVGRQSRDDEVVSDLTLIPALTDTHVARSR